MKLKFIARSMPPTSIAPLLVAATLCLYTGCSKAPTIQAPTAEESKYAEKMVQITANDQMKFDVTAIEAGRGQKVSVTLRNAGTMPKMSMGHNFVLLDLTLDPSKFIEAGQVQMANDYIAPEFKAHVLAHTPLLGPGESATVTFFAPRSSGSYPFLCSFPGHYAIGMKGVLTVR